MVNLKTLPFIHLNGTSRESLIGQRCDVGRALRNTLDALSKMTPHGRDYYLDPTGERYQAARRLHEVRVTAINTMMNEIEAEASAIDEIGRCR